jgi:hypothetical protein
MNLTEFLGKQNNATLIVNEDRQLVRTVLVARVRVSL